MSAQTSRLDPAAVETAAEQYWIQATGCNHARGDMAWVNQSDEVKRRIHEAVEGNVTAYLAAIEPQVRAIREGVKKMDMHYPHNDESGQPSEWLEGLHYGLKRVLPEFDALFALLGMEVMSE